MPRKKKAPVKTEVKNEFENNNVKNSLSDLFGFGFQSIGTQVSQIDSLFLNERWYLLSNNRQVLSQMYVEHGLVQTIVDVPVDDAFRGGIEITSKQMSPEEMEALHVRVEQKDIFTDIVGRANKWKRLYGGAGILIIDDTDPAEPWNVDMVEQGEDVEYRAVDLWELYYDLSNIDPIDNLDAFERLNSTFTHYNYYGKKIHKSRIMKMKGLTPPSFIRPRLRGWGFSVVEAIVRSINQYMKAVNVSYEVLDEFKIDVYKLKNLAATLMSSTGTQKAQQRTQMVNQMKNYLNAIIMDSEDDYLQKQVSFAGLADVQKEIRMQVASELRMPLTKIFGISAAGFNSGEDDIEVYNSMVESTIRSQSKKEIHQILNIECKSLFGYIPDDLKIAFKPLRVLSTEQEENVKTQKFNRILAARQAGELTMQEFRDACNKDNLLSITLQEADELELSPNEPESGEEEKEVKTEAPPKKHEAKEPKKEGKAI